MPKLFYKIISSSLLITLLLTTFLPLALAEDVVPLSAEETPADIQIQPNTFKNIAGTYGNQQINDFSGTLSYGYPLHLPAGRNGLTPSVGLSYNSASRATDGILGVGWNLNLPKIARYSHQGTTHLYDGFDFTSPLAGGDGELVSGEINSNGYGSYLPKVFSSQTKHIWQADNSWQVLDAAGKQYYFGQTENSREQSEDGSKIYAWYLTKVVDTNGNEINYQYIKKEGLVYLQKITYGDTDKPFEIVLHPFIDFHTSTYSTAILPQFSKGFAQGRNKYLLTDIEVKENIDREEVVYNLQYEQKNGLDFLKSIEQR